MTFVHVENVACFPKLAFLKMFPSCVLLLEYRVQRAFRQYFATWRQVSASSWMKFCDVSSLCHLSLSPSKSCFHRLISPKFCIRIFFRRNHHRPNSCFHPTITYYYPPTFFVIPVLAHHFNIPCTHPFRIFGPLVSSTFVSSVAGEGSVEWMCGADKVGSSSTSSFLYLKSTLRDTGGIVTAFSFSLYIFFLTGHITTPSAQEWVQRESCWDMRSFTCFCFEQHLAWKTWLPNLSFLSTLFRAGFHAYLS